MTKFFLLFMCLGCVLHSGYSQAVPEKFIPKKAPVKPATKPPAPTVRKSPVTKSSFDNNNSAKTAKPTEQAKAETSKPKTVKVEQKLETIFTCTEDCLLEIDGKWFGTLTKDEPKMIPLDFGQHKLLAQSKSSRELYNTTITILGNNQQVTIPMTGSGPQVDG